MAQVAGQRPVIDVAVGLEVVVDIAALEQAAELRVELGQFIRVEVLETEAALAVQAFKVGPVGVKELLVLLGRPVSAAFVDKAGILLVQPVAFPLRELHADQRVDRVGAGRTPHHVVRDVAADRVAVRRRQWRAGDDRVQDILAAGLRRTTQGPVILRGLVQQLAEVDVAALGSLADHVD